MTRQLVLIGSGETAPTLRRLHREVLASAGDGPALLLDTTYGFQTNADELTEKTITYFADSVGRDVTAASWRRGDGPEIDQQRALSAIAGARWVFAGPGSPSYALSQWLGTQLPATLTDMVRRGGTLVLGSAAAVTAGRVAIPVYEIYKAGADPYLIDGLDMLGILAGINALVVPHFDNAEGATHDTRYCYLGADRLAQLRGALPDGVGVLGVDEHTALVIDLDGRTARIGGTGTVTTMSSAGTTTLASGTELSLDELAGLVSGATTGTTTTATADQPVADQVEHGNTGATLADIVDRAADDLDAAFAALDVHGAVTVLLGLEQTLTDWRTDSTQSDAGDRGRRLLRSGLTRLGDLAVTGAADPAQRIAPFVDLAIELRARARAAKDFAASDLIRDQLAAAGVDVRDTADGATWQLADS